MAFPITPTADLKLVYSRDEVTRTYLVDLVLSPFGDLQLVTGLDRLEQDVRRWLQVALGSYPFDVTWGDPLWAERGRPRPAQVEDLIRASLSAAEDAFLRAQDKAAADGYLSTDEMLDHFEDVRVVTYATDPGRVDVLFTLVARSGNNRPAELWTSAGPFGGGATALLALLTVSARPGAVGPGQSATLVLSYNGPVGDTIVLAADVGAISMECLGVPSVPTFVVSTSPQTFPDSGCTLSYTAPPVIYGPGWATITAEALSGGAVRARAAATVGLLPAPVLTLAFAHPTVALGGQENLFITYAGLHAVQLSLPAGQGTLGDYEIAGNGTPQTWSVPYTAPTEPAGAGQFLPGTGFAAAAALELPLLVTVTGTDGLTTATATLTVLPTAGSALLALPGQVPSHGDLSALSTTQAAFAPVSLPWYADVSAAIAPHGNAIEGGGAYGQLVSQSVRGGGSYGQLVSQSVQGGGSVSGIPFQFHTDSTNGTNTPQSIPYTFFKVAGAPAGDTTIIDINFGVSGYMRAKLTSALHVVAECSLFGEVRSVDANAGNPISAGVWYWFAMSVGAGDNGFHLAKWVAQLWGPGGVSSGQQLTDFGFYNVGNGTTYTGVFGYGTTETSAYANWPGTTVGWELSKGMVYTAGNSQTGTVPFIGPPSADRGVDASTTALWLCRETVGTTSGIADSTANHFDLTPGPYGLTVVTDGPYP